MGRPRQPALDGVRGVAVAMVLLYHGGFRFASGGYLGVSVFFTLSGFLITRLLLDEHAAHGRIDLAGFWTRRVRRLMPAALLCVGGVLTARAFGAFPNVLDLGPDVRGAVLQVANWVQLSGDVSYAEQVAGARSPLDHFWSLAIEEQFYWCWPLILALVLRRRAPRTWIVGITALSVLAAPVVALRFGPTAAYWATPARVGEILVGASAAALGRRPPRRDADRWMPWIGSAGLLAVLICGVTWPADGGPATAGWLPVFAFAGVAVVLAADRPSWFSRTLGSRPPAALGTISYGVYLYHWPIFLLVAPTGGLGVGRFVIAVAITIVVAALSHRFVEAPVLAGRTPAPRRGRRDLTVAAALTVSVVALTSVVPMTRPDPFADLALAASDAAPVPSPAAPRPDAPGPAATSTTTTTTPTESAATRESLGAPGAAPLPSPVTGGATAAGHDPAPGPTRPVRVLVAGDSVAWTIGSGLADWADEHPDELAVGVVVSVSCGFVRHAEIPAFGDEYQDDCDDMLDRRLPAAVASGRPDLVVLMSTRADVQPHRWPGEDAAREITDPDFRRRHVADNVALTQRLLDLGVGRVVWLSSPVARVAALGAEPMTDPGAMAALREHLVATVELVPGRSTMIDLAAWYRSSGMDDEEVRPDGLHFTGEHPTEIADRFLARRLLDLAGGSDGVTASS